MAARLENIKKTPQAGHSGVDPKKLQLFIDRSENMQDRVDKISDAAKEACSPIREDMKDAAGEACDTLGISRSVYSAILRKRRLIKKANAVQGKLNDDHQDSYELVEHALGMMADLPLGRAILEETKH